MGQLVLQESPEILVLKAKLELESPELLVLLDLLVLVRLALLVALRELQVPLVTPVVQLALPAPLVLPDHSIHKLQAPLVRRVPLALRVLTETTALTATTDPTA